MATAREIKRRIKSVQNISQMTHAMQAVSASKVSRAQAHVLAGRPYVRWAWTLLVDVASQSRGGEMLHPLLEVRERAESVGILVITSDRGLAGPYNTNVLRTLARFAEQVSHRSAVSYIVAGRKGRNFLLRRGDDIRAEFSDLPDDPSITDVAPIARLAMDEFLSGTVDEVHVAYTDFINTLVHRPVVLRLLPLKPYTAEDMVMAKALEDRVPRPPSHLLEYIYEPSAMAVLDLILPRFTEVMVYQAVLESQACEHSARMVAMQTASENAEELVDELTLHYNKARQLAITSEMLDIVGGAEALSQAR